MAKCSEEMCRPLSPSTHVCACTHTALLHAVGNCSESPPNSRTATTWAQTPAYLHPDTQVQCGHTVSQCSHTHWGSHQNIARTLSERLVPGEKPPKQIPKASDTSAQPRSKPSRVQSGSRSSVRGWNCPWLVEESHLVLKSHTGKVRRVSTGKLHGKGPKQVTDAFEHQSALSQLFPIIYGLRMGLIFLLCFLFICYFLVRTRGTREPSGESEDFLILLSENSQMIVKTRQNQQRIIVCTDSAPLCLGDKWPLCQTVPRFWLLALVQKWRGKSKHSF